MITKEIADSILTIGCEYRSPKGGIAQVIDSYSKYVFATFLFSANSAGKSKMCKFIKCISAFIEVFSRLIIQRRIKIVHIHTASRNSFRRSILSENDEEESCGSYSWRWFQRVLCFKFGIRSKILAYGGLCDSLE